MDPSILTLIHMTCCILFLISSFLIIAPLSVVQQHFDGYCFIGVGFDISSGKAVVTNSSLPGAHSQCVYPEFMGVVLLIFSVLYIIWNGCLLFNTAESSWRDSFIGTVLTSLMSFMLFISCCVISHGLASLCGTLYKIGKQCSTLDADVDWLYIGDKTHPWDRADTVSFYTLFKMVEVINWISLILMVVCLLVYVAKLRASSHGDSFMDNLNREKERILDRSSSRRYDQI